MDEQKPSQMSGSQEPDDLSPLHDLDDQGNAIPKHSHVAHPTYDVHQPIKKRKSRRRKFLLFLALILAVGGILFYLNVINKDTKQTAVAPAPVDQAPKTDDRFFYQLGNKVIAYDAATKLSETLTDKLPLKARVIDIYVDNQGWRLYADNPVSDGAKTQIIYLEKGIDPRIIITESEIGLPVADAEHNVVAYSQMATVAGNLLPTRTITINNEGEKKTVYESGLASANSDSLGLKDPRYLVADISSDGTKLLFDRANCLYCDGGSRATSFELDLTANKATQVYVSDKPQGSTMYFNEGYLISETDAPPLGPRVGTYEEKYSAIDKIGSEPRTLLSLNEKDWANVNFDSEFKNMIVEKKAKDYAQTGNTTFGGLYELAGTSSKDLKKLSVEGGLNFEKETLQVSVKKDNCFSAMSDTRNESTSGNTLRIGVLCRDDKGVYSFTEIDKTPHMATQQYVQLLN